MALTAVPVGRHTRCIVSVHGPELPELMTRVQVKVTLTAVSDVRGGRLRNKLWTRAVGVAGPWGQSTWAGG